MKNYELSKEATFSKIKLKPIFEFFFFGDVNYTCSEALRDQFRALFTKKFRVNTNNYLDNIYANIVIE